MDVRVVFHNRTIDPNLVKLLIQFLLYKEREEKELETSEFHSIDRTNK